MEDQTQYHDSRNQQYGIKTQNIKPKTRSVRHQDTNIKLEKEKK